MRRTLLAPLLVSVTALLYAAQIAADMSGTWESPSVDVQETLEDVRGLLAEEEYEKALDELQNIVEIEPDNADAWNLTGFSERKLGNLGSAESAYNKALQLDPEHKGALEYQGELFLQQGKRESALENHELLQKLCPTGCDELTGLSAALSGTSAIKSNRYKK